MLKLKPRLRQNSFRRMPLLGTPTLTAGLRLVFGAHARTAFGSPFILPVQHRTCAPRKVCWSDGYGCLVPAGGVVAMRPLIVHASSKSLTDMPRLVLHMEYAADLVIADQLELALA